VFPSQNEGLSDGTYLAMAIVAAILFLLHELGHAFQAQREGMEIDGITLWLFGGVARFKGQFPSAGAEFRIAIAGPAVSLVLGILFVGLAAVMGLPEAVDGVLTWVGYTNVILLVFNLLPALPLDGGRVLRAILWGARDDFGWATRVSAAIGRGFGFLFIAVGLAMFILEGAFSGAWLAFIGWFLLGAASAEARYLAVRDALDGLRVRDLMVRDPVTVTSDMSIGRLLDEIMWSRRYTSYPVVDGGRPVGLLPFRCIAEVPRSDWDGRRVGDCMLPLERVPSVSPDDQLVDAVAELGESEVGRALVLDNGHLAGFLSITDVMRALELGALRRRRGISPAAGARRG
jgi:Zn-dependent protease/predicted transcriptional regulator